MSDYLPGEGPVLHSLIAKPNEAFSIPNGCHKVGAQRSSRSQTKAGPDVEPPVGERVAQFGIHIKE